MQQRHYRKEYHDVRRVDGGGGLPRFLRHADQAIAVHDAERLAGAGAVEDGVADDEVDLLGGDAEEILLQGDALRVAQEFVGRVDHDKELAQRQLQSAKRRFRRGVLLPFIAPVGPDAAPARAVGP